MSYEERENSRFTAHATRPQSAIDHAESLFINPLEPLGSDLPNIVARTNHIPKRIKELFEQGQPLTYVGQKLIESVTDDEEEYNPGKEGIVFCAIDDCKGPKFEGNLTPVLMGRIKNPLGILILHLKRHNIGEAEINKKIEEAAKEGIPWFEAIREYGQIIYPVEPEK
jgi:hypothetical protein